VQENELKDRSVAALVGAAVGDALGGATEGWEAREIAAHFGAPVEGIVPSIRMMKGLEKPFSPFHKGDGHITDDTLMTRALVKVYDAKRDHLDAFDVESKLMPQLIEEKVWIPELGREDLLYHRLFLAEKWLVARLRYGHGDPREAGVGNIVNCGAAMYIAPIGIANAADPAGAYAEAADVSGAHQSSYGREAAAVLAACVAEAMRPGATVADVVEVALSLAHDGTRAAIDAVAGKASTLSGWRDGGLAQLREAFAAYDSVGEQYASPSLGARIPSRLHSIEELPIAIGLLVATSGDFADTVLGGVNYGRDSDSIASMGGALAGALGGTGALRADWTEQIATASRYDLEQPGRTMAGVAAEIFHRDLERQARRAVALTSLTADPSLDGVIQLS
jgi:ADP-ribosylglycohydrolase